VDCLGEAFQAQGAELEAAPFGREQHIRVIPLERGIVILGAGAPVFERGGVAREEEIHVRVDGVARLARRRDGHS